ncbi:MAG: esterase [Cyanobacteriota bacterium]|jgi:2-succinyl-6-hydroxy-2,4-cyclohexadiene-1-carboxylate synthase
MSTLDILGTPHRYERHGSPSNPSFPILVFVHGWLLSHHYWSPLIQVLGKQYACVSYDLRGFGESQGVAPLPQQYSLAAYAADLVTLLEKLHIDHAWLVGHSLGGSIGIWGAHLCPERVKGVICLNAGGWIYLKEDFDRFRSAGENLVKFRPAWLGNVPGLDLVFSRLMVKQPLDRRWGQQRLWDLLRADGTAARGALLETTTEAEVHLLPQLVADLAQPVYFFAGQQDRVMEIKYVNYLASFHSSFHPLGQNVIELADCGHFAMLEQLPTVAEKMAQILQTAGH